MHPQVGIVSDTFGQVDARLKKLFRTINVLLHVGDLQDDETMKATAKLIPGVAAFAIHGNDPGTPLKERLGWVSCSDVQGVRILCAHRADTATAALTDNDHWSRASVVVFGSSPKPSLSVQKDGRMWMTPGGVGLERPAMRIAGLLEVRPKEIVGRLYSLEEDALPLVAEARTPRGPRTKD